MIEHIALLGFGEVGQLLATELPATASIAAYDKLFADPNSLPSQAANTSQRVKRSPSAADLAPTAQLVISAVTAGQSVRAAQSLAGHIAPDAIFLDLNSVAPSTRVATADVIESAGARYVEGAVMSAIKPNGIASPILLGGPQAEIICEALEDLGFAGARPFADHIGKASAVKMCRSVLIKGVEALFAESLLAATHYGVTDEVLASLTNFLPPVAAGGDWRETAQYLAERTTKHGKRRAEEMREVARTIENAGVDCWMSKACAQRQDWAAENATLFETAGLLAAGPREC